MPTHEKSFWKFKNCLTSNAEYVEKVENRIFENFQKTYASPRQNN